MGWYFSKITPFEVIAENALFFMKFQYPEVLNSFKDF